MLRLLTWAMRQDVRNENSFRKAQSSPGPHVINIYSVALKLYEFIPQITCLRMFLLFWLIRLFKSCFHFQAGREACSRC